MTDLSPAVRELLAATRGARGSMRLDALAEAVASLGEMFAGRRPFQPGYLARRDLRRAYVEYYLPLNAAKVARILDEMEKYDAGMLGRPLRILDYGAGPGTASVAFRLRGGRTSRLVLVDVVDEALDEAEELLGRTFERGDVPPPGPYDLVFAVNILAELNDPRRLEPILDFLDPAGYAVVVEPPTAEAARRLMEWRDVLVEQGWTIAAPCLGIARCPMRSHGDLWCHQDFGWSPLKSFTDVDDRLGRRRETLKYSYLVITREGKSLANGAGWRVVSNFHPEKGMAWAYLCGHEGDLWRAEGLSRDRAELMEFFRCDRGDLLKIEGPTGGRLGADHRVARA